MKVGELQSKGSNINMQSLMYLCIASLMFFVVSYLRFFVAMKPFHSPVYDFKQVLHVTVPRVVWVTRAKYSLLTAVGIQLEPQPYGYTEQRFSF